MNQIKKWFSWSLTVLIMFILFGVIFIQMDLAVPNPQFFLELSIVVALSTQMRLYWYSWTEYKVDTEVETTTAKNNYDDMVVELVTDTANLEKFLDMLNEQNLKNYIDNKLGNRTETNLKANRFYMFKLRNRAKKMIDTKEFLGTGKNKKSLKEYLKDEDNRKHYKSLIETNIGIIRFKKLQAKYTKRGKKKIKKITSLDIMTRCESKMILNVKNYAKQRKNIYQTITFFSNIILSTLFAAIAVKEIALNWLNVFRYLGYIFIMLYTIVSTILNAYKAYKGETFDHLSRLQYILDKYKSFKGGDYDA